MRASRGRRLFVPPAAAIPQLDHASSVQFGKSRKRPVAAISLHSVDAMTSSHLLICHPHYAGRAVRSIAVRVNDMRDNVRGARLALSFALEGEIARLRIPATRAPRMAEKLWQHTCFEAFLGIAGEPAYYEFNFAPSGEWMAYAFRDYRIGTTLQDAGFSPAITVRRSAEKLEVDAVVYLDGLRFPPDSRLRLGLAAVVEDDAGALSYWALQHPPGKPDFHDSAAFTIALQPGSGSVD